MLKEISLDGWVRSGEGGNAITYNNIKDDTILLKLAKKTTRSIKAMEEEINMADKVMKLNISTPKVIDKVQCNGIIGLIYERIHNKKSLGRLCHDNPQNIKEYAKDFARGMVELHSIKCADIGLVNYKDYYIEKLMTGAQDEVYTRKVIDLIKNEMDDCDNFLHGDPTVGNYIYANNKWYWIDFGRTGYGDPMFDLIDTYYTLNVLTSFFIVRNIFHISKVQGAELWDNFIQEYAYISNQNCEKLCARIKRLSVIFFYKTWASTISYVPIIHEIIHHNVRKYYDEMIGK